MFCDILEKPSHKHLETDGRDRSYIMGIRNVCRVFLAEIIENTRCKAPDTSQDTC